MKCNVCGKDKLGTIYRANGKKFLVCNDCKHIIQYNILEICSVCRVKSIVSTDVRDTMPRVIVCPCGNCMKGD